MALTDARFLRACRREPVDTTPIWFMRQAGRYLAEYRAVRAQHRMLDVINTPALAAEVTLQPLERFPFDAAIIFSDILLPLIAMGLRLDFVAGEGPQIENPLRAPADIDRLGTPPAEVSVPNTLEAIKLAVKTLTPRHIPLIGFAGAPFTLASYAVEGGGSKSFARTKALMYTEPAAWKRLMTKLVTVVGDALIKQAQAGAAALQVFDSWVGTLGVQDYTRYVLPYNQQLYKQLAAAGVPVINFSTGTSAYLDTVAQSGGDVIGVDWVLPLDAAWDKLGPSRAIQGNLEPAALLAPWRELKPRVEDLLQRAGGRPGHIFNLGHGILPDVPVETVQAVVDFVHEYAVREPA